MESQDALSEQIQWNADTSRLLKIALRSHDPEMLSGVMERMTERMGSDLALDMTCTMITKLMSDEDWSFFDESGNPSPLL